MSEPQPQPKKPQLWVAPDPVPVFTAQAAPEAFQKVVAFLVKFDYLKEPTTDHDSIQGALKKFQRSKSIPETGVYDAQTQDAMKAPWCGVPDAKPAKEAAFVPAGAVWDHTNLTFRFDNFTRDLSEDECRRQVTEAANLWAAVSPLTFREVSRTSPADIRIKWVTGDHGDGLPFETGTPDPLEPEVVAHGMSPTVPVTELAGDIHFDDRFSWEVAPVPNVLQTVALHELGHALGLAHSANPKAVMAPAVGRQRLHPDDMKGIHHLYGLHTPPWIRLTPRPMYLLAAGTTLFQLLENGWLFMNRHPLDTSWSVIDSANGNFKITSLDGNTLFSLTLDGRIRRFSVGAPGGWEDVEGDPSAVDIHATPTGHLIKRRNDGHIVRLTPGSPGAWRATELSAHPDCVQCIVDTTTGRVSRRLRDGTVETNVGTTWQPTDRDPEIADFISVDTELFKLRRDGKIFRNNASTSRPTTWEMISNVPGTRKVIAASRDFVFRLSEDGSLHRYYGFMLGIHGWEHLESTRPPQTLQAAAFADGTLCIMERDGEVYKLQN